MPLSDEEWDYAASVLGGWTPELTEEKRQARRREARWEQDRRRRERIRTNGPRESLAMEEVGDRDGWVCGICHDPIQRFTAPDPRSPSIDHVKVIHDGGTHTRDNVRIAHLYCNNDRNVHVDQPRRVIIKDSDGRVLSDRMIRPQTPEQARARLAHRVARYLADLR